MTFDRTQRFDQKALEGRKMVEQRVEQARRVAQQRISQKRQLARRQQGTTISTSPFGTSTLTVPPSGLALPSTVPPSGLALPSTAPPPAPPSMRTKELTALIAATMFNEYGYQPAEATRRAETFLGLYGQHLTPEIEELFDRSGIAGIAALELEDLLPSGFSLKRSLTQVLLDASDEQLSAYEDAFRSTERRLAQEDAARQVIGELVVDKRIHPGGRLTPTGGPTAEELIAAGGDPETIGRELLGPPGGLDAMRLPSPTGAGRFLDRLTGQELVWQHDDRTLVVAVGEDTYRVALDEPIGGTAMDAIVAVTHAIWGTEHTLVESSVAGDQTIFGAAAEFVGDVTRPVVGVWDRINHPYNWLVGNLEKPLLAGYLPGQPAQEVVPQFRSSVDIAAAEHDALVDRVNSAAQVTADDLIVLAAAAEAGDGYVTGSDVRQVDSLLADMTEAERDLLADAWSQSREETEKALEDLRDERNSLKKAVDATLGTVMEGAELWERFVQSNIVSATDFFKDLGEGLQGFQEDGFGGFIGAFEWEAGSAAFRGETTWADYLEVGDEWRGVTNLIGSIAGDPLTWVTLGAAAGRRELMERLLVTPEGALKWEKTAGRSHLARWKSFMEQDLGVLAVAGETDLSAAGLRRLRAGESVVDVVRDEMTDGLFIPALGGGTKMRDTASTTARMVGLDDTKLNGFLRRQFSQFETDRAVRLSPDGFFDDMKNTLMAMSADKNMSAREVNQWLDELIDVVDDGRWAKDMVGVQAEHLVSQQRRLATEATEKGFVGIGDSIARQEEIAGRIATAARQGDDKLVQRLRRQLPFEEDEYARLIDDYEDWLVRSGEVKSELDKARRLSRSMMVTNQRTAYLDYHERLWDFWFDKKGLMSPTGRRMVEKIRGVAATAGDDTARLSEQVLNIAESMGDFPVGPLAEKLGKAVVSVPARAVSPVSPLMMVAYGGRKSDAQWFSLIRGLGGRFNAVNQKMNRAFTANVLLNPFTFVRSNLDEPIRQAISRGLWGRASRVEGVPRVPGALEAGGRRLGAAVGGDVPEVAVPFARSLGPPIQRSPVGAPEYVTTSRNVKFGDSVVNADKAGVRKAAQSLFRTFSSQRQWQNYAAAELTGNFDYWTRYFVNEGGELLFGKKQVAGHAIDMTANEAYESMDLLIELLVEQVAPSKRDWVRRSVLRTLASSEPLGDDVARQFKMMPTWEARDTSTYGRMFDTAFGRPGEVHGGLVWLDFYEQARYILETRHQKRLLTPQVLAERLGISSEEAAMHLWRSSDEAMQAVRELGMFTPKQIHVAASRVASRHAEHMAYKMGAASLAGRKMGKAFPFLKAQMDFAGYYYRELTSGTAIGLNPSVAKALRGLGLKNVETTGMFIPHLPLNLRLAGRISDYAGTLTTLDDEADPDDLLGTVLDQYTFLPSAIDESVLMELSPGFAPLPSWILHMLPTEPDPDSKWATIGAAARDYIEAINPGFGFYEDQASWLPTGSNPAEVLGDFLNRGLGGFVLPDSSVSLRRMFSQAGGFTVGQLDHLTGWSNSEIWSSVFGAPPGFHTELRVNLAQALAENPERFFILEDGIVSDPESRRFVEEIVRDTYVESLGGEGPWKPGAGFGSLGDFGRTLARKTGFNVNGEDYQFLNLYPGLVEELGGFRDAGLVDDRQFDEIRRLWDQWENDEIDGTEASRLGDQLSDVLFGLDDVAQAWLVLRHPELVGNMVSQWKVDPERAPEGVFSGDRLVVAPGEDGRKLRIQGKREGWLVRRDPEDLATQMWHRYGAAVRTARNEVWRRYTGLDRWTSQFSDDVPTRPITEQDGLAMALGIEPGRYSRQELYNTLLESHRASFANYAPYGGQQYEAELAGTFASEWLTQARRTAAELGYENDPRTWPEEQRANAREIFTAAINNPDINLSRHTYDTQLAEYWGTLDYEAPVPPPLDTVPIGAGDTTYRLRVEPSALTVIDGDTVAIEYDPAGLVGRQVAEAVTGGPFSRTSPEAQRIRLIGVNAVERNEVLIRQGDMSWVEQTNALQDIVDRASTVDFVVFEPERFGTIQSVEKGETRWLMVMYVDGQPLWDSEIFTSVNPTGSGLGGRGAGVLNIEFAGVPS